MSLYAVGLFIHLLCLLLAVSAASLSTYAAIGLRGARSAEEAFRWEALNARVVPAFPLATVGLLGSGAYMVHSAWQWSAPWIIASLAGLGIIVVLGSGIEAGRARALARELRDVGMSVRARQLLCDPMAWSARFMTFTTMLAVVFVMTTKPSAVADAALLVGALLAGGVAAVPAWRPGVRRSLADIG